MGGEAGVNKGFGMLMGELPRERLMIGVQAAATMEAAFEFTRDYVKERKAFGKTIVSYPDQVLYGANFISVKSSNHPT